MELEEFMETELQIQREFQNEKADTSIRIDKSIEHCDDKVCINVLWVV